MTIRQAPLLFALLALPLASCSSTDDAPEEPMIERGQWAGIVEDEVSIGAFLTEIDKALQAWQSLTFTAATAEDKRRARVLQRTLEHGTNKRRGELIHQLEVGPPLNRVRAAAALGFTGSLEAQSPLLNALSDSDPDVVHNALLGLALLARDDTPLGAICEILEENYDPQIRSNAAYALRSSLAAGATGDCALPVARRAIIDPEPLVRTNAALILGLLGDRDSVQPLEDLIYEEFPLVRMAAVEALTLIALSEDSARGDVARALVSSLKRVDRDLKRHVRRALIEIAGIDYGDKVDPWVEWAQRLP